jgi:hypothetical protein
MSERLSYAGITDLAMFNTFTFVFIDTAQFAIPIISS